MQLGISYLKNYADRSVDWGFGELSRFIMETKYARNKSQILQQFNVSETEKEEWWEVVQRNVEGIFYLLDKHIPRNRIKNREKMFLARHMYDDMFNFVWTPAGRPMRNVGSVLLEERGGACLNNCSFICFCHTDPIKAFQFILDMSMNGVGVGIKVVDTNRKLYTPVKSRMETFAIPDTTQGWIDALTLLLQSHLSFRQARVEFDYSLIREKGQPIRTGGIHEGFQPLKDMLDDIRWVLETHETLCTRAIADISNLIGRCVVNGGQRRTALILLAEEDNKVFKDLKDYEVYPYRFDKKIAYTSNNSYLRFSEDKFDYNIIADAIIKNGNGEPAVVVIKNKKYGRLVDGVKYDDMQVEGANPCVEMFLENFELCNLMEVNLPKLMDGTRNVFDTIYNAVMFAKIISHVPTAWKETNDVVKRNHRIGISLTGVVDYISHKNMALSDFESELDRIYYYVKKADEKVSKLLRTTPSIRVTTVKPSGTVSLLMGTTAGIHASQGEFMFRHVELPKSSPYNDYYERKGYHIEPSVYKDNVNVVRFPLKMKGTKTQVEQTIEEQFELVATMQKYWSDNGVSVTVVFKEDEIDKIVPLMEDYEDRIKAVSFLKYDGHIYEQAPFMPVSESAYNEYVDQIRLKGILFDDEDFTPITVDSVDSKFCTTDYCELPT